MVTTTSAIHIMFGGQSYDWSFEQLDLSYDASNADIANAIASELGVPSHKITNMVFERNNQTGDITIRPQAVFGNV